MNYKTSLTRRSFLKQTSVAGIGALMLPHILQSRAFGAANEKLNIAVIGCGNRSRQLLPSVLQEGHNVVALCDVNPSQLHAKAAQAKKKKGVDLAPVFEKAKIYDDYRKLLETEKSVDAVIVCAGQRWHVPMSKACLQSGKNVFCEKPLAHSVAEVREIRALSKKCNKATQIGTQGGSTDTFRRSMEIIQAGVLGPVREVHCWINRTFPPSEAIATTADPIPEGLNWDFWCGPSKVLPFKEYYLGGCLKWGRWLEFGDGHLADMGAHAHNLPLRALKLGAPIKVSAEIHEPLKDSYPSATNFRWDFAARGDMPTVAVWWHDGPNAGPPEELTKDLIQTYGKLPTNGVLFVGEKGVLKSDAWGVGGVMKLKGDPNFRGVLDHEAAKSLPVVYPRAEGQNHMKEWLDACKGGAPTFQNFEIASQGAEIGMTGMVALRLGRPIEWDAANMKVKGAPEADQFINLPQRKKWLM